MMIALTIYTNCELVQLWPQLPVKSVPLPKSVEPELFNSEISHFQ